MGANWQTVWMGLALVPWYAWSVMANVAIGFIEYRNRTGGFENPGEAFSANWFLIVISQTGLFYAWRDAPSFMFAWVVFTTGNIALRIISSHFFVGEKLSLTVAYGVALVLIGGQLVRDGMGTSN
jgi:hypothetical protein